MDYLCRQKSVGCGFIRLFAEIKKHIETKNPGANTTFILSAINLENSFYNFNI